MSRALTEDQIERLFLSSWRRLGDGREVAILLYEAGRDGVEAALARSAERVKQRDLRRQLPDHLKRRVARVLLAVAERHGTTVEALLEKKKSGEGGPIGEAMWCLRWTQMSSTDVATGVHRLDHTTVLSACKRVERRFAEEAPLRSDLEQIAQMALAEDLPMEAAA